MPVMTCPSADEMRAYTLGQLSESDSDALFEHFQACESCRAELETVGDETDSLIASLREVDRMAHVDDEPDCKRAVAKALGALALATDDDSLQSSFLPQEIGEYEIVRPLGRGGMGSVYLARHTKLRREVAVKALAHSRLASPRHRERFEVEMRAIGRLSHPNIVTAHDAREVDGTAVLVMEYIDGMDLSQLSARIGPVPTAEACELVRSVAMALQYTSEQGFVHRDIKPSNIMLSKDGEVKLLDLGLARLQSLPAGELEITGSGQAMGTADYVAPEQVSDSRNVDVRTDIYGLGCTLYKLLTGSAPFAGEPYSTSFAKMTAHVSASPPPLAERVAGLPTALIRLVESMLAKSPDQRPQTPSEVAERLKDFAVGADLKSLAHRAASSPERRDPPDTSENATGMKVDPWWKRPIHLGSAVAAGLGGFFIGVALGVIVTITFPDGSKLRVEGDDGTQVTVEQSPTAESTAAANTKHSAATAIDETAVGASVPETAPVSPNTAPEAGMRDAPLQMALLVQASEMDEAALRTARQQLIRGIDPFGASSQVVVSDSGIWFPMAERADAPIAMDVGGSKYALVSRKDDQRVLWGEIVGQVVTAQMGAGPFPSDRTKTPHPRRSSVQLEFAPRMADRLNQISSQNLQRRLAVIVSDRIVMTPVIQGTLSNNVSLTGLTPDEAKWLVSATTAGLAEPLQPHSGEPITVDVVASSKPAPKDSPAGKIVDDMKQIALAFNNFHDVYQKFPGPANVREGGRTFTDKKTYPFSWRVAILPFIGQPQLYESYRFDEPWDSEANKQLLEKMPDVYRHPMAPADQPTGHTNYMGIAHEESAMGTAEGFARRDILDGTSNTLLVVESQESVLWTKPQDIEGELNFFPNRPAFVAMADGSVQAIEPSNKELIEKFITRAGHEVVELGKPVQ